MFNQFSSKYCLLRIWVKRSSFLFLSLAFGFNSSSQNQKTNKNNDLRIDVAAAIQMPVGNFSSTHFLGFGINVTPSYHTMSLFSKIKIAFTYNGGIAYYLGKKETLGGYPYNYPGYFFIHAFTGILFTPSKNDGSNFQYKNFDISMTGGPALGIYNGNTRLNLGGKLELNYHLKGKQTIGTGIILMKENGADALYAISIKAVYSL